MRRTYLAALLALFHTAAGSFGGSPTFAGNGAFTGNAAGGFPEARETLPHESAAAETLRFTPATAPEIRFVGRAARSDDGALSFDWSGTYFSFRFEGTRCAMRAADSKRNYYNVFVDGKPHGKVTAEGPAKTIVLAEGRPHGVHTLLVQKRTEGEQGRTTLFAVGSDGPLLDAPQAPGRHIEFIGDSHTDGFKDYAGLPNADYLCHNGLTVWSAVEKAEFPGKQTLAQALRGKHYGKIYLMLGINELGAGTAESWAAQYKVLLDEVRELQPDAIIFLQAIFHTTQEKSDTTFFKNSTIDARNAELQKLADNETVFYIDCNPVFDDDTGALTAEYSGDGVHVKAPYYVMWRDYLFQFGVVR